MDTKTALGAAGGIALTIVGAVSALVLTVGAGADPAPAQPAGAVVEYIDQFGNSVDPTQLGTQPTLPEIVVATDVKSDSVVAAPEYEASPDPTAAEYEEEEEEEEYEDERYEEEEYEEEEEDDDDDY